MGTFTPGGYVAYTVGQWVVNLRADLDSAAASYDQAAPDYDGTLEGAYTYGWSLSSASVDAGVKVAIDSYDPRTASGVPLDNFAAQVGISRRPATASSYVVRASVASGSYTLPAGTVVQAGGGDGLATWTTDAATVLTSTPATLDLTCQSTGPVALASTETFRVVTPQPVTVTVTYDSSDGDGFTLGRVRESDPSLRVRRNASLVAVPSPTRNGIRAGMLTLDWVQNATARRESAGFVRCTVYPAPATAAQEEQLVDAIGFRTAGAAFTYGTGADGSGTYTLDDGGTETVYWFEGGSQSVAVSATVVLGVGFSLSDVSGPIEEAVTALFESLDVGGTMLYTRVYCVAASIEGVVGLTLTLDGGTSDITPAPTDFLVPVTTVST